MVTCCPAYSEVFFTVYSVKPVCHQTGRPLRICTATDFSAGHMCLACQTGGSYFSNLSTAEELLLLTNGHVVTFADVLQTTRAPVDHRCQFLTGYEYRTG